MADFLFGDQGAAQKPVIYSGLQVPTSQYDLPVPWMRGQRRMTTNCIWYGDFQKHKQSAKGKGGGGKGSGQYTYTAAVALALGFGIIPDILNVWTQGSSNSTSSLSQLGLTLETGTAAQTPWSFVVTKYPSQAQSYPGIAYLHSDRFDLGSSASVTDMGFEARCIPYSDYLTSTGWTNPTTSTNTPGQDVNMADYLPDFLQDELVGGGFSSGDIPDLTDFRAYQAAQGLFFSPYLNKQEKATDIINRWARLANTWIYWSGTSFQVVPLGDQTLTANGYTYTPNTTIDYVLGPADFTSNPPVKVDIKDPADCPNHTIVSITDRTMGYVTNPIEYKSLSLIRQYGRRGSDNIQADDICNPAVGNIVAQLIGRRSAHLRKTYTFKTNWRFFRALPGCIFSLTDPTQGLDGELVRITSVEEDENGELTWSAEELPTNIGTYHTRSHQAGPTIPNNPDQQADPGSVNTPAVAEPAQSGVTDSTTVLIAASGGVNWGGANVWISFDDWASQSLIGKIQSPAIQGQLTAGLAAYGGANPDTGDTLSVDCTISLGEPEPVSNADADGLRTLSLVCAPPTTSGSDQVLDPSGELLAFGDTATTATYSADLTYLQRKQLGTNAGAHSTGDLFTLFDMSGVSGSTLQFTLPARYVGQPIWLKLASFNVFGKATQDLSVCQSYKFTPAGRGFGGGTGGVPGVPTGLSTSAGVQQVKLSWTANPITDNVSGYEVYRATGTGQVFGSASLVAVTAGQEFTDTGLAASQGYTYFLKAENAIGLSAATAGVNATTSSTPLGDVVGPAGATDGDFALFNGASGKSIKDTGLARDTDGTFAANSDSKIPSQKAVKTYVDAGDAAALAAANAYTDTVATGRSWKNAVRAATTANGTLASAFENGDTIDGVTLATGDRILIKNQSTASENGIYTVNASGAPTRAVDADSGAELVDASCYVSEGTTLADTQWTCTNNAPITLGVTNLTFVQSGSGATYTADGVTLDLVGTQFSIKALGVDTAQLKDKAVTLAKMNDMATASFIGRNTAGSGAPEVLSTATAKSLLGLTGTNSGDVAAASTTEQLTGTDATKTSTPDSVAALWEKGADVASGATTTLGEGGFFHITGTTTITALAFSTDKAGRPAWLKFDGALTLTHNATSLILPTAANITTAAGDCCAIVSEGGGNFRVVAYTSANGTALALANSGVFASIYGSSTTIPVLTIDAAGRVTSATTAAVTGGGGGGTAQHEYEAFGSLAAAASFNGVNISVTSLSDGLVSLIPAWTSTSTNTLEIWKKTAPSTPYNLYSRFIAQVNGNNDQFGLCVRNSSNGKAIAYGTNFGSPLLLTCQNWTNATTFNSTVFTNIGIPNFYPNWFRIENDGTNLKFYYGFDGNLWKQVGSVTLATFIGTADEIGLYIVPQHVFSVWVGNFGTTTPA